MIADRKQSLTSVHDFICLFFVRTRSYSSSITLMNDTSLCQNGG